MTTIKEIEEEDTVEKYRHTVKWIPILMYHRVVENVDMPDPYKVSISVSDFEAQMSYLKSHGYHAINLEDVPRALVKESPWTKPVVVTFDDGYMDTYTQAFPILQKYGITANVMLVSDYIGGGNTWDYGKTDSTTLMSLNEIQEMERGNIRFGAHGATHSPLNSMSVEQVEIELIDSKARLEELLGHEVATLAYPFGLSTPDVHRIAEQAGYSVACGIEQRPNTLFNLSRVDAATCKGDSLLWKMKVSGWHFRMRQVRALRALNDLRKRVHK